MFIKIIVFLFFIKKMGFDVIYIFLIIKNSIRYKKGEMGLFYVVKNFFEFDLVLYDFMVDDLLIDEQFKVLIEVCYIFGIRFIIDIILRIFVRDFDFILEYFEWFYWIKIEDLEDYGLLKLILIKEFIKVNEDNIEFIYKDLVV